MKLTFPAIIEAKCEVYIIFTFVYNKKTPPIPAGL
jgi:hypothetical protein